MAAFLHWFDESPERYWWFVCLVFSGVSFVALRPLLRKSCINNSAHSDWYWGWAILGLLLVGRWPILFVPFELNPDESQLIAGAATLRHDPIFWRSVDGGTAGPLDFYALLPAGWLTGHDSFLSARFTALVLVALTLLFIHQSVALGVGREAARLGGLSALFFEALTLHTEFLHYSTELVSVCLLAAALYIGTNQLLTGTGDSIGRFFLGLLLGAVPFAKLQAAPLAVLLGLAFMMAQKRLQTQAPSRLTQQWSALIAGAAAPGMFFGGVMWLTGEWQNAVIPYLSNNLNYIGTNPMTVMESAAAIVRTTAGRGSLIQSWLLSGTGLLLLLPLIRRSWPRRTRWITLFCAVFLIVAFICIFIPRRPFPHYLQLLVIPWTLLLCLATGQLLEAWNDSRNPAVKILLASAAVASAATVFYGRTGIVHPVIGTLSATRVQGRTPVAGIVLRYAREADALAIWGWMPQFFVETRLRQATRSATTTNEIVPGPYREFFRQRYLTDLRRSQPSVFIDAIRTQNGRLRDQPHAAYDENFPALAAFVQTRYRQVAEVEGARIYVRKDRFDSQQKSIATPSSP